MSSGLGDDYVWLSWETNQTQDLLDTLKVIGPINAAFMLLFFLVGVPWNLLVIGVIVKKKLFTRPSVMLMLNLAIVNLLVCLLVMINHCRHGTEHTTTSHCVTIEGENNYHNHLPMWTFL